MTLLYTAFAGFCIVLSSAIPIDNGIVDPIKIQCSPRSVKVSFETRKPWSGVLFVRNYFENERCKKLGGGPGRAQYGPATTTAEIELEFDGPCGLRRERSVNPRGVLVYTTVIMSFHEHFLTKVDRAVRVQCFYMEADKTVNKDVEVSQLTTVEETSNVPMPVCKYQILDGPTGAGGEVRFAFVGQKVYHKWTCESETPDIFCMLVYNCYVDDGQGDRVILLNEDGCALDPHLLQSLEYSSDLVAGQSAHVFKYADRTNLYFNCQIRIDVKEPNKECKRPKCPETFGSIGGAGYSGGASQPSAQYNGTQYSGNFNDLQPGRYDGADGSSYQGEEPVGTYSAGGGPGYPGANYDAASAAAASQAAQAAVAQAQAQRQKRRFARSTEHESQAAAVVDVAVPNPILVGDVDMRPEEVLPSFLAQQATNAREDREETTPAELSSYCLSGSGLTILVTLTSFIVILSVATSCVTYYRAYRHINVKNSILH